MQSQGAECTADTRELRALQLVGLAFPRTDCLLDGGRLHRGIAHRFRVDKSSKEAVAGGVASVHPRIVVLIQIRQLLL